MMFLQLDRTGPDSVAVNGIKIPLSDPLKNALRVTAHSDLTLGVRPNDISIVPPAAEHLNGVVTLVQPQGDYAIVAVMTNSGPVTVVVPSDQRPRSGAAVGLAFTSEALQVFDSSTRSLLCGMEESGG
jgi:ABC-type sugar transport system ATPase subunit